MVAAIAVAIAMIGCQKPAPNSAANNANTATGANSNAASNANGNTAPASTETKTDSPALSMATPTDTYKAAYAYRKNKDIEGLKKTMSKDILEFLTMIGEDDKKSLDDQLKDLCDKPQAPTNESRNEKITGDTATLEYPDEKGEWKTMDFEKVGPDWKMSIPKGPMKSEGPPKKK